MGTQSLMFFFCGEETLSSQRSHKQCAAVMKRAADSDWMLTKVESSSSSCTTLCVIERSEASRSKRLGILHFKYIQYTHTHTICLAGGGRVGTFVRTMQQHYLGMNSSCFVRLCVSCWRCNSSMEHHKIILEIPTQYVGISLENHVIDNPTGFCRTNCCGS